MRLILTMLLAMVPFFAPIEPQTLPYPPALNMEEHEVVDLSFLPDEKNLSIDEKAEKEMLELVNAERRKMGLNELVIDRELVEVARKHSYDMWEREYFAHENPDGETPFDRIEESDIDFVVAGENLALAKTLRRAHQGLMDSDGHRENILDPEYSRIGIGVIDGGIYGKMFTQNFAD